MLTGRHKIKYELELLRQQCQRRITLLDTGAAPSQVHEQSVTLLTLLMAVQKGHGEIVQMLEKGAAPS